MNLLLDTNIVLNVIRAKDFAGIIKFINPNNAQLYLSIVSEAELKSIAIRNNWGVNRRALLDSFLDEVSIIGVNQLYVNIYAEIDAFSQRANPAFPGYDFDTPRNMGKNDLWIASLAALLSLELVTTDADFNHLHNVFFDVRCISPVDFLAFF
ncbi:type II toxin-antitoxin system VapC family toxin [Mucilaginibacter angelicae]|uniref:Type II toxin-antitoxin system VapC family toxin n=1 Tax=Mucilaginibacter angelicae TaxID=869718 RepID=A0ABV6L813_9SPHI